MHGVAFNLDGLGIQIDGDLAGLDNGLCMPLRAADNCIDTRREFFAVEGFFLNSYLRQNKNRLACFLSHRPLDGSI
jgi:hypothetical protein